MKSQRVYQILVVFMLILPGTIFSQQQMPLFAQKMPHIKQSENARTTKIENSCADSLINNHDVLRPFTAGLFPFRMEIINTNFTVQHLPFFCKKEFLFEKSTSVPLRIRLGSLDYVNKLEGKENHWSVVAGN